MIEVNWQIIITISIIFAAIKVIFGIDISLMSIYRKISTILKKVEIFRYINHQLTKRNIISFKKFKEHEKIERIGKSVF